MKSGIVERLRGCGTVHIDTNPFIYFLEGEGRRSQVVGSVLAEIGIGEFRGTSSCVTLLEVLVKPLRDGRRDLADQYRDILVNAASFALVPLDRAVAESAAQIRAKHNFKTPDAIQLASALHAGATAFLTNDTQLRRFEGLDVVILDDFVAPGL